MLQSNEIIHENRSNQPTVDTNMLYKYMQIVRYPVDRSLGLELALTFEFRHLLQKFQFAFRVGFWQTTRKTVSDDKMPRSAPSLHPVG